MSIAVELLNKLTTCLAKSEAEDVDLESYVDLWSDLGSVLAVMGSVFKFVKSDVDDKGNYYVIIFLLIFILVAILKRIHGEKQYKSVHSMMKLEKQNDLINYKYLDEKNPSGSRTLLRLHRALKMVALLLHKVATNAHNGKMSSIGEIFLSDFRKKIL